MFLFISILPPSTSSRQMPFIHIRQKIGCRGSEGVIYFPSIFRLHLCNLILFIYLFLDETVLTFTAPSSQVYSGQRKAVCVFQTARLKAEKSTEEERAKTRRDKNVLLILPWKPRQRGARCQREKQADYFHLKEHAKLHKRVFSRSFQKWQQMEAGRPCEQVGVIGPPPLCFLCLLVFISTHR